METLEKAMLSNRLFLLSLQNYKHVIQSASATSKKTYSTSVEQINEENCDVIVTGGGMIGTTMACALG